MSCYRIYYSFGLNSYTMNDRLNKKVKEYLPEIVKELFREDRNELELKTFWVKL